MVLGMHRSGTSALTGVLARLGVSSGSNLMPADSHSNPKGHWENPDVSTTNELILEQFGTAWDDITPLPDGWWKTPEISPLRDRLISILRRDFPNRSLNTLKDPRLCRLMPLWKELLASEAFDVVNVLCLRHPAEVALSLGQRDGLTAPEACLLWLSYVLSATQDTGGRRRAFVMFDDLLSDWRQLVKDVGEELAVNWPIPPEDAATSIEEFLDARLRHYERRWELPDHPACQLAERAFETFSESLNGQPDLDALGCEAAELINVIGPWHSGAQYRRSIRQISLLEGEIASLRQEVSRLKGSVSWRITAPMRAASNMFRRFGRKL